MGLKVQAMQVGWARTLLNSAWPKLFPRKKQKGGQKAAFVARLPPGFRHRFDRIANRTWRQDSRPTGPRPRQTVWGSRRLICISRTAPWPPRSGRRRAAFIPASVNSALCRAKPLERLPRHLRPSLIYHVNLFDIDKNSGVAKKFWAYRDRPLRLLRGKRQ